MRVVVTGAAGFLGRMCARRCTTRPGSPPTPTGATPPAPHPARSRICARTGGTERARPARHRPSTQGLPGRRPHPRRPGTTAAGRPDARMHPGRRDRLAPARLPRAAGHHDGWDPVPTSSPPASSAATGADGRCSTRSTTSWSIESL